MNKSTKTALASLLTAMLVGCGGTVQTMDDQRTDDPQPVQDATPTPTPEPAQDAQPDDTAHSVLTVEFGGPEASIILAGEKGVWFFKATLTSTQDLEIRKLPLRIQALMGHLFDGGSHFRNIRVVSLNDGHVISGPVDVPSMIGPNGENSKYFDDFPLNMADAFVLTANQPLELVVMVDVASDTPPDAGNSYRVTLDAFKLGDVRYAATAKSVPLELIAPNTTLNGNTMTVIDAPAP